MPPDYNAMAAEALGDLARLILLRDRPALAEWWSRWEAASEDAADAASLAAKGEWKAARATYYRTCGSEGLAEMADALEALSWRQDAEGI